MMVEQTAPRSLQRVVLFSILNLIWCQDCGAGVEGRFSHPLASLHEVGRVCGEATTLGGTSVPFR